MNEGIIKQMYYNARARARRKDLAFNLTQAYLKSIWPGNNRCPIFNFPLKKSVGKQGPGWDSPTLDRILPDDGYVQGNVIIISSRANLIKQDVMPKEMYKVADFFYELIN